MLVNSWRSYRASNGQKIGFVLICLGTLYLAWAPEWWDPMAGFGILFGFGVYMVRELGPWPCWVDVPLELVWHMPEDEAKEFIRNYRP